MNFILLLKMLPPTFRQKFPNLLTDMILITGKDDAALLDGRYNWIIDSDK